MRKIIYRNIEYQFVLDQNIFYNIIIKNHKEYFHFVNTLLEQTLYDNEGDFTFSIDSKELSLKKNSLIIQNMFNFDLSSRKITNLLYNEIKQQIAFTNYLEQFQKFERAYIELLEHIKSNISINVDYEEEIDLNTFFKFAGIVPVIDNQNFLTSLLDFIKIVVELTHIDVFWTLNLKDFLTAKELNSFVHEMNLLKVNILNIETHEKNDRINNQINLVIDEDLCDYNIT